jgi:hypothetical protein
MAKMENGKSILQQSTLLSLAAAMDLHVEQLKTE